MDGTVDSTNYLQTTTGSPMLLYAAVRGQMLYVATQSPGSSNAGSNDHFIVVANQLSPTLQPAFPAWNKIGSNAVAATMPFLSGESINTYVGWQQVSGSISNTSYKTAAWNSNGNPNQLMEGTINLVQAFGSMPSTIWVCAAAYWTTDGGGLVGQGPAGNGNGNIESNEFLAISIPGIIDTDGDGVYDRLDPARDFTCNVQTNFVVNWTSVPGKQYQVMYADTLSGKCEFAVLTEIENPHLMLKPVMSGYSKISCGRSSLLSLISRRAVHFVRVEFWSWW
jgi:hypothetical protein